MIKAIRFESLETWLGLGEAGTTENEHEITQFGNIMIWFGLCLVLAMPLWLVSNLSPDLLVLILPLPLFHAVERLSLGSGLRSEVFFVHGIGYLAGVLSPILVWRPSTPRYLGRIILTVAVLHTILLLLSWGRVVCLTVLALIFLDKFLWRVI